MNTVKRLSNCRLCYRALHRSSALFTSPQINVENEAKKVILNQLHSKVKIPKAKTWSKTAVLEALKSTVGSEVTPDYQDLHSPEHWNFGRKPVEQKHNYREQGQAMADYFIDHYNHLFQHDWEVSDIKPWIDTSDSEKIDYFEPPSVASESKSFEADVESTEPVQSNEDTKEENELESETTSESDTKKVAFDDSIISFQELLDLREIERAIDMFHQLHTKNIEIPQESVNQFLGLVAFYRASDQTKEWTNEYPLRAYSYQSTVEKDDTITTVTNIFDRLPWKNNPDLVQAYVLALGNWTKDRARKVLSIFEHEIKGKMKVSTRVYDEVLLCALSLSPTDRYGPAKDVLDEMKKQQVAPDYVTFCYFFRVLPFSNMSASRLLQRFSRLLMEMNACGIECGPEIFAAMITVTVRHIHHDRDVVLEAIFDFMSGKNLRYQHPLDLMAYIRILNLCSKRLDHVKKVMEIVQYGNNSMLLASCPDRSFAFYVLFFEILKEKDTIENVFYFYRKLVPMRTYLTPKKRHYLIDYVRDNNRPEYLPILYAGLGEQRSVANNVLDLLYAALSMHTHADEDTKTQLKHMAMIEIQFATTYIRESRWDRIMNLSFELVLLLSQDLNDALTCFNKFLSLKAMPPLQDKLLKQFEEIGKEHKSSAVTVALEQYRKRSKKSLWVKTERPTKPSHVRESEQRSVNDPPLIKSED